MPEPFEKWFPVRTSRLLLREYVLADERDIHEYASDPNVVQYVDWGPNSAEMTRARFSHRLREQSEWPRTDVTLAIELLQERRLIGHVRLAITDRENRTAELGYVLHRSYWNHGYATEAARAIAGVAFSSLGMHRLYATCDTRNAASVRVLEKLGMRQEAQFVRDLLQKGEWRDSCLYAVLEDEFER